MDLKRNENVVLIPANTEIVLCQKFCNDILSTDSEDINGFGLKIVRQKYSVVGFFQLGQLSPVWLLFSPSKRLKTFRNDQADDRISLNKHTVNLAFGSLISPHQFKCVDEEYLFQTNQYSRQNIFFSKNNSSISININSSRFTMKSDHIDSHRGVIIDMKSMQNMILYVCLKGNLDEYVAQSEENGMLPVRYTRRFCLQNTYDGLRQQHPCFSTIRLSVEATQRYSNNINKTLCNFIQFFNYHDIPIHFGSIEFLFGDFIYKNNSSSSPSTFLGQYAWQMLNTVSCRMHDQMINNPRLYNLFLQLSNGNNDELFYYLMGRLRRIALSSENYFLSILKELPIIGNHYNDFYLDSIFYRMDMNWNNYVRIPWFCITPTCFMIKPFKFMRSNRVFRYLSSKLTKCMAFVEFRDNTGSAYLPKELLSFLKHYLENGFYFGGRRYIYLHHAQSQIRNKQFYFYCEHEGGMTREELETWMGNFDKEKLPAKNTARRTQPFSSTEATIEIDKKLVKTIPDVKTGDGKYNFTDGVGQISSELNILIHQAIGIDADDDDLSSVLQIRYGSCKGTVAVNPRLDGQTKQLLIRDSMKKFECDHQILELCKRSLRRRLCLNREVINLLSYRGISSECLLTFQLHNILWLTTSLISNEYALSVLREKILHVLPWSQISYYSKLAQEPFFYRLLHTTITNNLHQLVTRAHIRVSEARYVFGIVDEYKVLKEGQVFVQITDDNGNKTVLTGPVAITKNPCRHPGDLRVLQAVDRKPLHHLYDVLVFPQQGSRPHASEISGSDLDGDEYSVIWHPKLVPTSRNPPAYNYDSGPPPKPLNRIVTRNDRLKVILDICEQDNLGRLSNLHLALVDKFGIDSEHAISLAGGLSQELDSVKSGQHPYTFEQINELNLLAGRTRPDFMQTPGYQTYPSDKILGKLFRSASRLSNTFSTMHSIQDLPIILDENLLCFGYENYVSFAQKLYRKYQFEMFEILGSYGFTNEIDLFCCIESARTNSNERSDIQHTAQLLLKELFRCIRQEFNDDDDDDDDYYCYQGKEKAAACYYVAYTDNGPKDKRMLSFPWLFASQLLMDYPIIEEEIDESVLCASLKQKFPSISHLFPIDDNLTVTELFEHLFQKACDIESEDIVDQAEMLLEELINISKNI